MNVTDRSLNVSLFVAIVEATSLLKNSPLCDPLQNSEQCTTHEGPATALHAS